jgi:hypothetical protein
MKVGLDILRVSAGEVFERDFIGQGEIIVRREGNSRARHVFMLNGRVIARLRWRGQRRAVYEAEGVRFDISVRAIERRIAVIAEDGSESFLVERSRANPRKEKMRVEMAEGDNFCLMRAWDSRLKGEASLALHKEFYNSTLLLFRFNTRRRSQTTVRVEVMQVARWESRFLHRLLALTVCRIILERRHSGSQPVRVKEKQSGFATSTSVRQHKRVY